MSRARKAVLISFIILLMLAVLIFGIISICLNNAQIPVERTICYDKLIRVMEDDIVYLSDEFLIANNLERDVVDKDKASKEDVHIYYNKLKVDNVPDFSSRVKNLSACSYTLISKSNSEEIPVTILVSFSVGKDKNKKHKYKQEYNGFKYCTDTIMIWDKQQLEYNVKTTPRKGATCIMSLIISIKEDVADNYTEEQKSERIEQIFKSAVDNIVLYQNL